MMRRSLIFQLLRIGQVAIFVGLMVGTAWAHPAPTIAVQVNADLKTKIQKLIQQLGAEKFIDREAAAQRLIEIGEPATDAVRAAMASTNPDIAARASELVNVLSFVKPVGVSKSDATEIVNFRANDSKRRATRLRSIANRGRIRLAYYLMEKYPESKSAIFNNNSTTFHNMILNALSRGSFEDIDYLLGHPITLENAPGTIANYRKAQGRLPEFIQNSLGEFKKLRTAGQPLPWVRVRSMIALLRCERRFDEAIELVDYLPDGGERSRLESQILFETGQWRKVLKLITSEGKKENPDRMPRANEAQIAFLQMVVGDEVGYRKTVAELEAKLPQESGVPVEDQAAIQRNQLLLIGLANLDWKLVEKYLDPEKKSQNFDLLMTLNRHQAAFESIQLPPTVSKRYAWVGKKIRRLKSLDEKIKRLRALGGRNSAKITEARNERQSTLDFVSRVVDQLGDLGLTDESELYYQMLFENDPENLSTRSLVLAGLLEIGRQESIFPLLEGRLGTAKSVNEISNQLFRSRINGRLASRMPRMNMIQAALTREIDDPKLRLKTLAGIVNSPVAAPDDFDLDYELSRFRTASVFRADGMTEAVFADVLALHGREEESRKYLEMAAMMGDMRAKTTLLNKQLMAKEYDQISDAFFEESMRRRTAADSILSSYVESKLSDAKSDRLWMATCNAYACWFGRSYSVNSSMAKLSELSFEHLATFYLKASVYGLEGNQVTSQQHRKQLVNALLAKQSDQHQQGVNELVIDIYNDLAVNTPSSKNMFTWSMETQKLLIAIAKLDIKAGRNKLAAKRLIKCAAFRPGDSSIGEETISLLDAAGAKQEAQAVFDAIASFYQRIFSEYPDAVMHHNNFAWTCCCAKRMPDARRRHAAVAVKLRPHTPSYLDTMAESCFLDGEFQKAYEFSRRCVIASPQRQYYQQQVQRFKAALEAEKNQ